MSLAKNRFYFAYVASYVNEIRALYLAKRPAGVANSAKIFADWKTPRILNFGSTQTFQILLASALDSFLFGSTVVALILLRKVENGVRANVNWVWGIWGFVVSLVVELGLIFAYWHIEESEKNP